MRASRFWYASVRIRVESESPLTGSVRLRSTMWGGPESWDPTDAESPLPETERQPVPPAAATAAAMERAAGPSAPRVSWSTRASRRSSRSCCLATRFSSSSSRDGSPM
eukprot:scaffold135821_cov24-Tisochrysis_lutea.AAC.4